MATQLEIWSGAFAELVGGPLQSLDDTSAGPIRAIWPTTRHACETAEQWPWSKKRIALVRSEAPDRPWRYAYALPPDIIGPGPIGLYDSTSAQSPLTRWEQVGDVVYADSEMLWADYQYAAPVEAWPPAFVEWVRLKICQRTAITYTGSESRAEGYKREAREQFNVLINAVLQASPPTQLFDAFQTTSSRAGYHLEPIALRPDDQGRLRAI